MKIADHWSYPGGDSCADFWTACVKAANLEIPDTAHVLEIGCAEFDWLTPAAKSFPDMTFVGMDWRSDSYDVERVRVIKSDVRNPNLCTPQSFDWIVSISAIEHVGLGHYSEDPLDPDGDIVALANAWKWLKIGGWLMFDVPYNPAEYVLRGTSHREYDEGALWERCWTEPLVRAARDERKRLGKDFVPEGENVHNPCRARLAHTLYCEAGKESQLIERPTVPLVNSYHYACIIAQRVG